ncbi:hypothetical protein [Apibacter sp. wkB309]|uniref:hypothetical protein n=1 Tax=Apibacter sp. wkB309 TaxID=1679467 RepID=UPI000CFA4633|nr:hypothetical protein [Apibacter sp. wkB309]PQL92088.1 hypothetical protein C4S75_01865 [Apibacter sp. wkB309]
MNSSKFNNDIIPIAKWILKIRKRYLVLITLEFPNIDDQVRPLIQRNRLTVTNDDLLRNLILIISYYNAYDLLQLSTALNFLKI